MSPASRPQLTRADQNGIQPVGHGRSALNLAGIDSGSGSGLVEFEQVYRGEVDVVTAYFARRCAEPQIVADLTSETFVRAAGGFGRFDPGRGSARAWLFGI